MIMMVAGCLAATACGGSSSKPNANASTATANASGVTTPSSPAHGSTSAHGYVPPGGSAGNGSGGTSAPNSGGGGSNTSPSGSPTEQTSPQHLPPHSSKYSNAVVAAATTFANCVRSHGVPIQQPNFSGHGEIFSDKGVNPNSPQFHEALKACEAYLLALLRAGGAKLPGASG
jgi:hypothetical protein